MLCLIPARGGSKGVPRKNIKHLAGYPLVAYTIVAARNARSIQRVIVSTDSEEIAEIARSYGAEVPFLRPAAYAADTAGDREVIRHALQWLQKNEEYEAPCLVYLRPTTPLRDSRLIDQAVDLFLQHPEATALRSAHETVEPAYKFFKIEHNYFTGLFPDYPHTAYYDLPRQLLPPTYHPNGYVDIVKTEHLETQGSVYGDKILPFITPVTSEIDRKEDFDFAEFLVKKYRPKIYRTLKEQCLKA